MGHTHRDPVAGLEPTLPLDCSSCRHAMVMSRPLCCACELLKAVHHFQVLRNYHRERERITKESHSEFKARRWGRIPPPPCVRLSCWSFWSFWSFYVHDISEESNACRLRARTKCCGCHLGLKVLCVPCREELRDLIASGIPLFGFYRDLLQWLFRTTASDVGAPPPTFNNVFVELVD